MPFDIPRSITSTPGQEGVNVARDRREVVGLGHDGDAVVTVEQEPQAATRERVIVGEDDPDQHFDGHAFTLVRARLSGQREKTRIGRGKTPTTPSAVDEVVVERVAHEVGPGLTISF